MLGFCCAKTGPDKHIANANKANLFRETLKIRLRQIVFSKMRMDSLFFPVSSCKGGCFLRTAMRSQVLLCPVSKVCSTNAIPETPREAVILSEAFYSGVESVP